MASLAIELKQLFSLYVAHPNYGVEYVVEEKEAKALGDVIKPVEENTVVEEKEEGFFYFLTAVNASFFCSSRYTF
jgi:hypothetical protein